MSSTRPKVPASTRIRDNQRRSRAQRKEFVDSLQQRVLDYERRGVAATVEVQRAARAVALENAALHRLLARYGVGREEVEREVRAVNDERGFEGTRTERLEDALRPRFPQPESNPLPTPPPAIETRRCTACQHIQNHSQTLDVVEPPTVFPASREVVDEAVVVSPSPSSFVRTVSEESDAAETSCVDAARIIAQMRGDGDDFFARTTLLGCEGEEECRVRHLEVFRVLDEV
jgi:hypothetical protein